MTDETMAGALEGVRVVDLTHFEAGPFATLMLAGLGADVIKVERPGVGDAMRMRRPGGPDVDAPYFKTFNAGKRSIAINLSSPRGREAVLRLIARADIVVENFSPGTLDRLGLGYAAAKAVNDRLIYAHVCGFPPQSHRANFPSYDAVAQAVGGSMSVTGLPDGQPLRPGVNLGDSGTGMTAAMVLCAALFHRERTGRGQEIFVPMQDVILNLMRAPLAGHLEIGRTWPRVGNQAFRHALKDKAPFPGPSDVFACAGGGENNYCFIHVLDYSNRSYEHLFATIGQPSLIEDPRFSTHAARLDYMDELDALVAAWCATQSKWEVMEKLGRLGITAGAVADSGDILSSESLRAEGAMIDVAQHGGESFPMPGFPARMESGTGFGAAPALGGDTEAVLREAGYDPAAIATLRAEGSVG